MLLRRDHGLPLARVKQTIVVELSRTIASEVERLRSAGLRFRNDIVSGPGGQQILVEDPSGNAIELFQPAQP
jgi:hypothetical protein